jgi:hypothetical protein
MIACWPPSLDRSGRTLTATFTVEADIVVQLFAPQDRFIIQFALYKTPSELTLSNLK